MRKIKELDFLINKNNTIARVIDINGNSIKLRKMRKIKELDFLINKNNTIARVIDINGNSIKLRKMSIKAYSYQDYTSLEAIKKNWTLISTENLLILLNGVIIK